MRSESRPAHTAAPTHPIHGNFGGAAHTHSICGDALSRHEADELSELLAPWLAQQRWYVRPEQPDKASTPARIVCAVTLTYTARARTIFTLVAHAERIYSVPLFLEAEEVRNDAGNLEMDGAKTPPATPGRQASSTHQASATHQVSSVHPSKGVSEPFSSFSGHHGQVLIGSIHGDDGIRYHVCDATAHPTGQIALLQAVLGDSEDSSTGSRTILSTASPMISPQAASSTAAAAATSFSRGDEQAGSGRAAGQSSSADESATAVLPLFAGIRLREPLSSLPPVIHSHRLTSEQSNTSIIYECAPGSDPAGIIVKVLRLIQPGRNPDVELEAALDHIPESVSELIHSTGSQAAGEYNALTPATHTGSTPTAPAAGGADIAVVPRQYGYTTIRYPQADGASEPADARGGTADVRIYTEPTDTLNGTADAHTSTADVLVASEFLAGSHDAWQIFTHALSDAQLAPTSSMSATSVTSATDAGTSTASTAADIATPAGDAAGSAILTAGAATSDDGTAGHAAVPAATSTASTAAPDMMTCTQADIAALGELTRTMHSRLAAAFSQAEPTSQERAAQLASWQSRAAHAFELSGELRSWRTEITALYERAARVPWPLLQRIHGDYHLGQVLRTSEGSWRVIDFEGEPLRPLSERTAPDLALRDVAGMLRSLSYAAGFAVKNGTDLDAAERWERIAHETFLNAYGSLSTDQNLNTSYQSLLMALLVDKALYEVSYETAYRPEWVDIPIKGVRKIIEKY
ncbi:MAG: hypothetical protein PUK59_00545 [Actinomycetaceae bacterium]|nr:hypothetical protein [Actinomycetaceae bacterium]MDY5854562.1 hypothetical protein [Arcanobacterium sp.]